MRPEPISRDEARALDAWAADVLGLPTLVLMENAGRGAAALLRERVGDALPRALVLCGPGNNGGDGGVVARHLDLWGFPVRVVWFGQAGKFSLDAAVQRNVLDGLGLDQRTHEGALAVVELDALLAEADWIVDALLGTGLTRPVEGALRGAVEALNRAGKPILALDLPSGLDADAGRPLGVAVRATLTATFVAPKLGFAAPGADDFTGEVHIVGIGVPARRAGSR